MDDYGIKKYGISTTGNVFRNIPAGSLIEKALIKKKDGLSRAGDVYVWKQVKERDVHLMINML